MLSDMAVLDISQQLPGPYASALLAQLGANVTKIEPVTGDPSRVLDPAMFEMVTRGKTCVQLDLKSATGQARLHELVRSCDVFLEGFRPGVAARLGADWKTLSDIKPDIVYCSISGAGQDGPFAQFPMHDLNLQAMAGGRTGDGIGVPWVDLGTGSVAALAIVAAWHHARSTGTGSYLDAAMLDTAVVWTRVKASAKNRVEPTYGTFPTADGRLVAVAILEDHIWTRLCVAMDWADWAHDPGFGTYEQRVTQASQIENRLATSCSALTLHSIMELAGEHDLSITPVDDGNVPAIADQRRARRLAIETPRLPLPLAITVRDEAVQ